MDIERVRYRFNRHCNPSALRDELLARGIAVALVNPDGAGCQVDLFPADFDRAAGVVAAHDAAGADAAEAQAQARRQQARQAIVGYPDLATPTNAQTVAVVKALCLAVAELYRAT
jgi:hypothetical protein